MNYKNVSTYVAPFAATIADQVSTNPDDRFENGLYGQGSYDEIQEVWVPSEGYVAEPGRYCNTVEPTWVNTYETTIFLGWYSKDYVGSEVKDLCDWSGNV